jgi:hypothetical protein
MDEVSSLGHLSDDTNHQDASKIVPSRSFEIPWREGRGADPVEKHDPRKTSNAGKAECSKVLDLNAPNREVPQSAKIG